MADAVCDTGPLLHLDEIGNLRTIRTFSRLILPDRVAVELNAYGIPFQRLASEGTRAEIQKVLTNEWEPVAVSTVPPLQPADCQVFVLWRDRYRDIPVLTDDLVLRRHLEGSGAKVIGSVGILMRAYKLEIIDRPQLETANDALFHASTLHLSPAFREYVRKLLSELG